MERGKEGGREKRDTKWQRYILYLTLISVYVNAISALVHVYI